MSLSIVILAAGNGTRMKSNLPKVLHPLGGIPMLERIILTAKQLNPTSIHVVYGQQNNNVKDAMQHLNVSWVLQKEQLGTGHAVAQVMPVLKSQDQILVLFGDVPLITADTLCRVIDETPLNGLGVIISKLEDPTGFGRIIRNKTGNIIGIVEHKDADEKELEIKEINTGIMTGSVEHFKEWLPQLEDSNSQHEYYLTDIVSLAVNEGVYVGAILADFEEVRGVNDRWQLAKIERYYQKKLAKELALSGVTVLDYQTLNIRGEAIISKDVILDSNITLEGKVTIGEGSYLGPNTVIRNSQIGKNCVIEPNSFINNQTIVDDTVCN